MGPQRFRAVIAADPDGRAVIAVPFDPEETWGAKADHPISGAIDGRRIRGRLQPGGSGWVLTLGPRWQRDMGYAIGDHVAVDPAPEGPQRGDLADDIAAALAANRPRARSSTRSRSSTAMPTSAGSTGRPVGRTSMPSYR